SGNKRDGVLRNGTWIADGQFHGALRFSGNDFVTVDNFPNAPSTFSVSAWVRSANNDPDAGFETVLSTELVFDGGWQLNLVKNSSTTIQFAYWDRDAGAYTTYDCDCLPANQWTHVVSVVDGATHTLSVYINGQIHVSPAAHAVVPGTSALLMGTWFRGMRFLVGDLDDVSIYDRVLASAEVAELGKHPPPDPM
ncbi:MAG: LamG domain-containing protein, partial [Myxococcota bacterium]|nr:LamG domain-containing protein [Myxococcota bacterium]